MNDISKHQEIFRQDMLKNIPVHIIGCGATGSNIALQLVKLGVPDIHLYDMDTIEEHNIANQIYRTEQVGEYKTAALKSILDAHKPVENISITEHRLRVDKAYIEENGLNGIVFVATDTMESRKEIYEAGGMGNPNIVRWIEMRLDLAFVRLYSIRPATYQEHKGYMNTLYSSDEVAVMSACGISQTAFPTASFLASMSVWEMLNTLNGEPPYNEIIIDLSTWMMVKQKFEE